MPRHLISDAHEWINEIPTVPICYLAKPQPRERAWNNQRGKKTLKRIIWSSMGAPEGSKIRIKLSYCSLSSQLVHSFFFVVFPKTTAQTRQVVRDHLGRGSPCFLG